MIKTGSNFLRTGGHFEREWSNNRPRRDRRDRPVKVSISQKNDNTRRLGIEPTHTKANGIQSAPYFVKIIQQLIGPVI